jgi:hypothetical protein
VKVPCVRVEVSQMQKQVIGKHLLLHAGELPVLEIDTGKGGTN